MRRALLLVVLACVAACAHAPAPTCAIDSGLVRPWAEYQHVRQVQEVPYAVEYRACGKRLIYVAARHTNVPQSATFRLVRTAFAQASPQFVIVEGFPASFGTSPVRMRDHARQVNGGAADGEPFVAIRSAVEAGIGFSGGEPTDSDVLAAVRADGLGTEDLFAYYVLRNIEQWRREQRITGPDDPALDDRIRQLAAAFARDATVPIDNLAPVATLSGFKAWYEAKNGITFDAGYRVEDAFPTTSTIARATNRISDQVNAARDRSILNVIARALHDHDTVLVVYGASHHAVEAPALEHAFGPARVLSDESGQDG